MPCNGNSNDHCCYLKGKACSYVEENTVEGRRWACGLRRELGDWDLVLKDPRYIDNVKPKLQEGVTCKDWPDSPSTKCFECGFNVEPTDHGWKEQWQ